MFFPTVLAQTGEWSLAGSSGVVCIHTALLTNSRLLCFARPEKDQYPINANTNGLLSTEIDLLARVNADGTWTSKFTPVPVTNNPFCAGHALLPNGSVFVAGGDNQSDPYNKDQYVNGRQGRRIYNPCPDKSCIGSWTILPDMTSERWYPTVVTLADGSVLIVGGNTKNLDFDRLTDENNPTYEYWPPKQGTWPKRLDLLVWAFPHHMYPITYQLPSGKIMIFASNKTILIDQNDNVVNLPDMPQMDHSPWIYPHTPTAAVLPMTLKNNYSFVMQVCGGSKLSSKDASPMCWRLNADDPNPTWTQVKDMPAPRLMPDVVLLPDGKMLYVNGLKWGQAGGNAGQVQYARDPVYQADLYDPETETWTTLASATQKRLYHSGALLLESGHVVTTGSEMDNYDDFYGPNSVSLQRTCMPTMENQTVLAVSENVCRSPFNYNIERFTPPYLQKGERPVIKTAPAITTHGSVIQLDLSSSTDNIARVTFTRLASTTHSTNTDQRFIELKIIARSSSALFVQIPENKNIAIVGNWFIWALDKNSVPSVAKTINLQLGQPTKVQIPADAKSNALKGTVGLLTGLIALLSL
ncbi:hypothetical protein EDD86DRAFT_229621 [Gorgonomyces haynaldii]|nr:hypothetical protein EDD86DRAFT_229621 [Gorgonomyces haynaldii]